MSVFFLLAALLLFYIGYSSATYCICEDGVGNSALQKTIDYACGSGADCSAILQNGACFQPNTVKAHCDYAANSYYQRKGQVTGSCDFSGAATISTSLPGTVVSGCTYPASPSLAGSSTTTPRAGTSTTGTPSITTTGTPSTTVSGVYGTGTDASPTSLSDSSSKDFPLCFLSVTLALLSSFLLF